MIENYGKTRVDLVRLLHDTGAAIVTTMIDFFGLPDDFPRKKEAKGTPYEKVVHVEKSFPQDIDHPRFRSYLNLHEFEGLLFSSPSEIASTLHEPEKEQALRQIRDGFRTPEEINDNPQSSPSKRILALLPTYRQPLHRLLISTRIGLNEIRKQCLHFNEWLNDLERIV